MLRVLPTGASFTAKLYRLERDFCWVATAAVFQLCPCQKRLQFTLGDNLAVEKMHLAFRVGCEAWVVCNHADRGSFDM